MSTSPHHLLMRYARWATNGLNGTLASHLNALGAEERHVVLRLLDHVQTVEDIFRYNLEGRPHGHAAPRSAELPSFETLACRAATSADWYVDYADGLRPEGQEEAIDFAFSSGERARMTRGEMLLHVAMHGAYHRGNVGILLQKKGIEPHPDRLTDFLASEGAGPGRPLAELEETAR